jgi:hypothetical protein
MAIYIGKRKQRRAISVFVIDAIDNVSLSMLRTLKNEYDAILYVPWFVYIYAMCFLKVTNL